MTELVGLAKMCVTLSAEGPAYDHLSSDGSVYCAMMESFECIGNSGYSVRKNFPIDEALNESPFEAPDCVSADHERMAVCPTEIGDTEVAISYANHSGCASGIDEEPDCEEQGLSSLSR